LAVRREREQTVHLASASVAKREIATLEPYRLDAVVAAIGERRFRYVTELRSSPVVETGRQGNEG
jgi:hypothetical protein